MTIDYTIRQYQPGDETDIVSLLELVFNGWPHFDLECTSLDHWKWKYLDNPLKMTSIVVGISNDKIIGCDHATYANMYIQKKTQLCTHGTDSAVHPEYRGIGVYSKMRDLKRKIRENALKPVNLSHWMSGNPILIKSAHRRKRPYFKDPIIEYIHIKDVDLHLANRKDTHTTRLLKRLYINLRKTLHAVSRIFNIARARACILPHPSADSRFYDDLLFQYHP